MLVHCINLSLVCLVLLFLVILRNLLETVILYFLDHPVDRHNEVKEKDQEDDNLQKDGVDVERPWHGDGGGERGNVGEAFVSESEDVRNVSHSVF